MFRKKERKKERKTSCNLIPVLNVNHENVQLPDLAPIDNSRDSFEKNTPPKPISILHTSSKRNIWCERLGEIKKYLHNTNQKSKHNQTSK